MKSNWRATMAALAFGALTVPASAVTIDVDLSLNVDLNNAIFLYQSNDDASKAGLAYIGHIDSGDFSDSFDVDGNDIAEYSNYTFTLLAQYSGGVVVGMNDEDAADASGQSFESTFPGFDEDDLYDALDSFNESPFSQLYVANFASTNKGQFAVTPDYTGGFLTTSATLMGFTEGSPVGTLGVQVVPEPGTMAVLGLGAVALLRRRKKA